MVAVVPLIAGCGFEPMLAEGTAARALTGQLAIPRIDTPFGFALRERLVTRLGGTGPQRYSLVIDTDVTSEERAIRGDNTISRFTLRGQARFAVSSLDGGPVLTDGTVQAFTAYSAVGSAFATRAAEDDARKRLAETLADRIVLRLQATARDWAA